MPKDISVLTIPNDTFYLPVVGAYVTTEAAQLGFQEADIGDIRLAVDEACTHIIETAFEPGEEQVFTISCQRNPTGLKITIADQGLPFDSHAIPDYDAHGGLDRELSGLPFYLIQQTMDQVRFVNKGRQGKEIRLTKYLQVPSIEAYFPPEELGPYDTAVEPAPSAQYTFRLMKPTDAIQIARCVYKTYGYTYPGEQFYYPERVVSMNQSGEMISAVAVTETGEVIGHCALSGRPGEQVMEVGRAVVDPAHRRRGVMKGLMNLLMEQPRQQELTGLFVFAVTVHPFSQRAALRYGFRESGLLLAYVPRAVHFKKIAGQQLPQRETVVYGYQPLRQEPPSRVYPPPQHRSITTRIYSNLGLEREMVSAEPPRQADSGPSAREATPSSLSTEIKSALGTAVIEIADCGPGVEGEVKRKLRDLCYEGIDVVYLHLPLGDWHTPLICPSFEELGFFFAGIQPRPAEPTGPDGISNRDLLCLQYLNGPRINYDLLQTYSDFSKDLVQYVQERDPLA